MKKAYLKKVIAIGAVVAATAGALAPLGVSAISKSHSLLWNEAFKTEECKNEENTLGWVEESGNWYYCDQNGSNENGWVNIEGSWYYFNKSGEMKTGWIKDNRKWYYADNTGVMQTGVLKINENVYYFNSKGIMQTGKVKIGNTTYNFGKNGQAIGDIPNHDKEFDSNNCIIGSENNDNTSNEEVNDNNNNNNNDNNNSNDNNSGNIENEDTSKDEAITDDSKGESNNQQSGNQNSTGNSGTQGSTGGNNSSSGGTVNVNGLPSINEKYSVTIQSSAEQKILELMNAKRKEAGLKPLTMDNTLLSVARYKSNHMIQNDYFSHTNPDGTNWTNWLKTIGYSYNATAENIAYNSYNAEELFNQWWNSAGHKANMMNASYTKVGIGVIYGNGKYMGTQTFSN